MICSKTSSAAYRDGWKAIWAKPVGRLLSIPKESSKIIIGHHKTYPNCLTALVYIPSHRKEITFSGGGGNSVSAPFDFPNMFVGISPVGYQNISSVTPLQNYWFHFYLTENENPESIKKIERATFPAYSFTEAYSLFIKMFRDFKIPKHLSCPTVKHLCSGKNIHSGVCKKQVVHTGSCSCTTFHTHYCSHRDCSCACICLCCKQKCSCRCNCICCRDVCYCSCNCKDLLCKFIPNKYKISTVDTLPISAFFSNYEINGSSDRPDSLYVSSSEIGLAWNTFKENWLVKTSKMVTYELLESQFLHNARMPAK